jgi:hypothetical protein
MNQLLVSTSKNFVYHFIPRAGSSSLKYHLQRYLDGMVVVPKENVEVYDSPLHKNMASIVKPVDEMVKYPNHFKFLVVRNPHDRIISYYYEYVVSNTSHFGVNTFEDYIGVLNNTGEWTPQFDHVMPISEMSLPNDKYDRVYKLEDDCFNSIQTDLNLEEFEDVKFSVSARLNNYHDLTEKQLYSVCKTVDSIYYNDLTNFNYNIKDSLYFRKMNYAPC